MRFPVGQPRLRSRILRSLSLACVLPLLLACPLEHDEVGDQPAGDRASDPGRGAEAEGGGAGAGGAGGGGAGGGGEEAGGAGGGSEEAGGAGAGGAGAGGAGGGGAGGGIIEAGDGGAGGDGIEALAEATVSACRAACEPEAECGLSELAECQRDCDREEGRAVAQARDAQADRQCLEAMRAYFTCLAGATCDALRSWEACEADEAREERSCRGVSWWRD